MVKIESYVYQNRELIFIYLVIVGRTKVRPAKNPHPPPSIHTVRLYLYLCPLGVGLFRIVLKDFGFFVPKGQVTPTPNGIMHHKKTNSTKLHKPNPNGRRNRRPSSDIRRTLPDDGRPSDSPLRGEYMPVGL